MPSSTPVASDSAPSALAQANAKNVLIVYGSFPGDDGHDSLTGLDVRCERQDDISE
jgi:hypothetical protein